VLCVATYRPNMAPHLAPHFAESRRRRPLFEKPLQPGSPAADVRYDRRSDSRRRASSVRPGWHARTVARTHAVYYRDSRGAEPVNEFIQALPPKRAAKIDAYVEEYLNGQPPEAPPPAFPITSQIEGELRELRIRFANTRYRVLYQRSENLVVLLHALEKDTGSVPQGDIELAKQRMADFKRRMDAIRRTPPRAAGKDAPPPSRPL
jgi:phage-related protein